MAKKLFQKGNKFAKGGARPNSGPAPYEFKEAVKKIGDPLKVVKMFWDMSQDVTKSSKDRLKAGELYLDRVVGKVPQPFQDVTQPNEQDRRIVDALRATVSKILEG